MRSRAEALALFRIGQADRQIFETAQNRTSSRSHGVFEIRIAKIQGAKSSRTKPPPPRICKLSMVDLAGSERAKHTQNTGDRLREASHINTGLMSLGRCMEIVRLNQHNKRKTLVPYKHSKLTEIFKSFFLGEGSAVMLVCVNPFDTGFDENSHVMRFAAVARSIQTTATATTSKFVPVPEGSDIDEGKSLAGASWSGSDTDVLLHPKL